VQLTKTVRKQMSFKSVFEIRDRERESQFNKARVYHISCDNNNSLNNEQASATIP